VIGPPRGSANVPTLQSTLKFGRFPTLYNIILNVRSQWTSDKMYKSRSVEWLFVGTVATDGNCLFRRFRPFETIENKLQLRLIIQEKIMIFRVVLLCNWKKSLYFEGTYRLYLQGCIINQRRTKKKQTASHMFLGKAQEKIHGKEWNVICSVEIITVNKIYAVFLRVYLYLKARSFNYRLVYFVTSWLKLIEENESLGFFKESYFIY
jgi:hypothetical protein